MKYCRECGKETNAKEVYCNHCGAKANDPNALTNEKVEQKATVGFILGLCSLIAWIIPLIGYPVTIVGIVFSAGGRKAINNRIKARVGLILSILGLIASLINSILGVLMHLERL